MSKIDNSVIITGIIVLGIIILAVVGIFAYSELGNISNKTSSIIKLTIS
jgi:hypothetical protein